LWVGQQAAHDLLISNQVSKGFEQLAGEKLAVRLGGIYALEGVMNTSEQYHGPVTPIRQNRARTFQASGMSGYGHEGFGFCCICAVL
jgi:hypothetical protein